MSHWPITFFTVSSYLLRASDAESLRARSLREPDAASLITMLGECSAEKSRYEAKPYRLSSWRFAPCSQRSATRCSAATTTVLAANCPPTCARSRSRTRRRRRWRPPRATPTCDGGARPRSRSPAAGPRVHSAPGPGPLARWAPAPRP